MLTIIAAMEYELVGLRRALRQSGPANPKAVRDFGRPTPGATELQVELHAVGVGREPAQAAVTKLLAQRRRAGGNHTDALLLLGFAGGLDPGLRSGDLCLPSHFIREDGPVADAGPAADAHSLEPDAGMRQQAACVLADSGVAWSVGDSLTVSELVATPEAKAEKFRQYRAGVVDMEDYWFADLAARQGMPFLAVRAVLDPAQQVCLPMFWAWRLETGIGAGPSWPAPLGHGAWPVCCGCPVKPGWPSEVWPILGWPLSGSAWRSRADR